MIIVVVDDKLSTTVIQEVVMTDDLHMFHHCTGRAVGVDLGATPGRRARFAIVAITITFVGRWHLNLEFSSSCFEISV